MNLQPWRIKVVSDQETKEKVFAATFGQEQVRICSHVLILCADVDYPAIISRLDQAQAAAGIPAERRKGMVSFATKLTGDMTPEQRLAWSREQVHIALGNAVNGAYCPRTRRLPSDGLRPGQPRAGARPARQPGADGHRLGGLCSRGGSSKAPPRRERYPRLETLLATPDAVLDSLRGRRLQ